MAVEARAVQEAGQPQEPLTDTTVMGLPDSTAAAGADPADDVEPIPAEQVSLDEEIRARLQAVFDRVSSLSDVTVSVDAGVVRLSGTVTQRAAVDQAVELARSLDGVVFVDEQIEETASLAARMGATWDRLRGGTWGFLATLPLMVVALAIVLAFSFLGSLVGRGRVLGVIGDRNPFLQGLVGRLLQFGAVLAGVLIALELLDATALVGAVVGTAGIAGLALGFAFKDIAENYLAGVLLSIRQPFAKSDHIAVGGYEGKIVRLTAREVILMTLDGNHVQIPNGIVFREAVTNYSRNPRRRFSFLVDVDPETDLSAALDLGLDTLGAMSGVMEDPSPHGVVHELAASTVQIRFFGWVDQRVADFARVRSEAIRMVKQAFDAAAISMPSPEYRVAMSGAAPAAPPERRPAPAAPDGAQRDVSVDTTIDEQIEEDRRLAHEPDLLETADDTDPRASADAYSRAPADADPQASAEADPRAPAADGPRAPAAKDS